MRAFVRETNEQGRRRHAARRHAARPPDSDDFGGVRVEKMSRMRQTIARNMVESYTTIPQLTNFDDADVTELEDMREQSKADYADRGIKLTAMPFVIKAVASSLKRHPMLNASVDMESEPDHLQGIREHRHRRRHRARPRRARAPRRRPQEHLANRLASSKSSPTRSATASSTSTT